MNMTLKNTKILTSLAVILSLILVSGCLGGGDEKEAGLGADSLELAIDSEGRLIFDSGETFTITMDVENVGLLDVFNVNTTIIGYGGLSGTTLSGEYKMAGKLDRPRPDLDMVGGSATWDWDVNAPTVAADAPDVVIKLTGEVYYTTKSTAVQKVVAAKRDYVVKLQERGEAVPEHPATNAQNGPISLDVEVPGPYVSVPDAANTSFRVKFILRNDGSGNVYARTLSPKKRDYLEEINVTIPKGLTIDTSNCDLTVSGSNVVTAEKYIHLDATNAKLRLMEGGLKRDLGCRINVDESYVVGYQTFDLNARVDYTYLQDITREITTEGV